MNASGSASASALPAVAFLETLGAPAAVFLGSLADRGQGMIQVVQFCANGGREDAHHLFFLRPFSNRI